MPKIYPETVLETLSENDSPHAGAVIITRTAIPDIDNVVGNFRSKILENEKSYWEHAGAFAAYHQMLLELKRTVDRTLSQGNANVQEIDKVSVEEGLAELERIAHGFNFIHDYLYDAAMALNNAERKLKEMGVL